MARRPTPHDGSESASAGLIDTGAVNATARRLSRLEASLPTASVSGLAQEVLARMARRAEDARARDDQMTSALCRALLGPDESAAKVLLRARVLGGGRVDALYLDHLAGAARALGRMWESDAVSSAQVTIAAGRIYALMRGLSARLTPPCPDCPRRAIFAAVPGERHGLGVAMAADLMRREGWLIDVKVGRDHEELVREIADSDLRLLGLSAACSASLEPLIRLVAAVRISRPDMHILLAGPLVERIPDIAALSDVDVAAADFETARAALLSLHDSLMEAGAPALTH